ncbi:hypothetical protein AAG570_011781, partial [Ranatra chinensis]
HRELSLLGLLLIAIGTGGIKPCVSAFGGDQFRLPEQEKQLATFFSIFYFSINLGSVASSYLTPILKKDVQCLDSTTCYPLAFGVPSILMIFATVIFIMGKSFYIMSKPGRNIILEVINCVKHAVAEKLRIGKHEKKGHWLDYANDKFDETLISDIKAVMGVLHMFLPVPIFWALYDQQTSRWIAQAESMNGQLGSYYLLPEQMQALNPFLVLMFIPVFDYVIYPVLTKLGLLTKPLQRLGAGGILAAIAFIVSAMVELKVENGKVLELTPANTIHILWQLPQIIIITLAEVMFSITGLQFAFTQAPISMKSVVASLWLLTTAFGNVIVAIVAESHLFKSQVYELLLFAGLMLADMIFFIFLAVRYKYKTFN